MNRYIVVLASGGSSRFGDIKQLTSINGECLVNRVYRQATNVDDASCCLTLGANAKRIAQHLDDNVCVIKVTDWEEGLSRSIAVATAELKEQASHIMFVLADQVDLSSDSLTKCWHESEQHRNAIVCAKDGSYAGPPVIFPQKYFSALTELKGDVGAKPVIQQNSKNVIYVCLPDASTDIDTQHDLEAWKKLQDQ